MKYWKLKHIVKERVDQLQLDAIFIGSWGDGGSSSLKEKLDYFEQELVRKYDLRPSEYNKLNDVEIGEPLEFKSIIEAYKISLAKDSIL